jgi:hypothetical protein
MTISYTGDHIENNEVQYIFDSIFQKISQEIIQRECVGESDFLINCLFQKYKIQFYSVIQLTYKKTINPSGNHFYLDIASIQTVIRSCFETYLIFEYIFNQSSSESEIDCKILLYKRGSAKEFMRFQRNSLIYNQAEEDIKSIDLLLEGNSYFLSLSEKDKKSLKNNWRPSWMKIGENTLLSNTNNAEEYNSLSMYAHNTYHAIMNVHYYYNNLDKYDVDSTNSHLYIITTLFSKSIIERFNIRYSIFTNDEIGIMGEFIALAKKERHELKKVNESKG